MSTATAVPVMSNPRSMAVIENWPYGYLQRCKAEFVVETHPTRGQRVKRRTENKTKTGWNTPKHTSYARRFVICDGNDGMTYLIGDVINDAIGIWQGDMKHILKYV